MAIEKKALIVKCYDSQSGECSNVHEMFSREYIDVNGSSGIANINRNYGIVLYIDYKNCEKEMKALHS